MIPKLYDAEELDFINNGLGFLTEATKCTVSEERNGLFELEMEYPVNGKNFSDILNRQIIYAKPSPEREAQPFRIYNITKNSKSTVRVYAAHISYDLQGVPVAAFEATTAQDAIEKLNSQALIQHPFTFYTDKTSAGAFKNNTPAGIRSIMGGKEGSILDTYLGEWLYDKFTVSLLESRGADDGALIAYGKNLTTLEQEENIAEVYTGVLPFWYTENDGLVTGAVQNAPGQFGYTKILTQDFTDKFQDKPTVTQLNEVAVKYIQINKIGVPKVALKVSFVDLRKSGVFQNFESIDLCDTVNVSFEKLGIYATSKVIKTVYDVILDRYESIEIGEAKDTITETIARQEREIQSAATPTQVSRAAAQALSAAVAAAEEGIRQAEGRLAADIGDVNAGLHVIATANDIENWKQAGTTLYATVKNDLDGKVETAQLSLYAIQTEDGNTKTLAEILADQITLDGMVSIQNGSLYVGGNIYLNTGGYSVNNLTGAIVGKTIAATDFLTVKGAEYIPTQITSREYGNINVLAS